jgi:hypothetical protein
MCIAHISIYEMLEYFGRHVQYLHVVKTTLLLCRWMHCRVLFLMLKCVSVAIKRFIVGELFFLFSLLFFSPPAYKLHIGLLYFLYFYFYFFCVIYYFLPWYFCKSFISFKFNHLISISHILLFLIWFLFF